MRICHLTPEQQLSLCVLPMDVVGQVKWQDPSLSIPPGGANCAICKVEQQQSMGKSILIVEADETTNLPAVVLVPLVVLPPFPMDNSFTLLLRNESQT